VVELAVSNEEVGNVPRAGAALDLPVQRLVVDEGLGDRKLHYVGVGLALDAGQADHAFGILLWEPGRDVVVYALVVLPAHPLTGVGRDPGLGKRLKLAFVGPDGAVPAQRRKEEFVSVLLFLPLLRQTSQTGVGEQRTRRSSAWAAKYRVPTPGECLGQAVASSRRQDSKDRVCCTALLETVCVMVSNSHPLTHAYIYTGALL
jgi:hypothetical protein